MIEDWRLTFVNSPADAPFLVNELGGLQDQEWPVLRQAFHQAVAGVAKAAVIANSDMGYSNGRVRGGLPSGGDCRDPLLDLTVHRGVNSG